ncbi:MAG TPA: DsbE family thiol:disulfide interchange protein [Stellaceae bacterium]|jgi:cytochrome c biogenesis protein CcmG/thiol:disulfide interchange protein DsbE
MKRLRWATLAPLIVFGLIAAALYGGLGIDTMSLPSPLIDEPAPQFSLPPLPGRSDGLSNAALKGHVSLVNAFASWCVPCREEHAALMALAGKKRVPIYGIDYKDKPDEVLGWLGKLGDPYTQIGADSGAVGIDWGIYGVPETFLIDRAGRIRYKHVGPLTRADIDGTILPLVTRLQQ